MGIKIAGLKADITISISGTISQDNFLGGMAS